MGDAPCGQGAWLRGFYVYSAPTVNISGPQPTSGAFGPAEGLGYAIAAFDWHWRVPMRLHMVHWLIYWAC